MSIIIKLKNVIYEPAPKERFITFQVPVIETCRDKQQKRLRGRGILKKEVKK